MDVLKQKEMTTYRWLSPKVLTLVSFLQNSKEKFGLGIIASRNPLDIARDGANFGHKTHILLWMTRLRAPDCFTWNQPKLFTRREHSFVLIHIVVKRGLRGLAPGFAAQRRLASSLLSFSGRPSNRLCSSKLSIHDKLHEVSWRFKEPLLVISQIPF